MLPAVLAGIEMLAVAVAVLCFYSVLTDRPAFVWTMSPAMLTATGLLILIMASTHPSPRVLGPLIPFLQLYRY